MRFVRGALTRTVAVPGTATALVVVATYAAASSGRIGIVVIGGAVLVLLGFLIPLRYFPSIAIVIWVLVPRRLTVDAVNIDIVYGFLLLAVIGTVKALLRPVRGRSAMPGWLLACGAGLVVWLTFVTALTMNWTTSGTWTVAVLLLAVAPALLVEDGAVRVLRTTWVVLAAGSGVYLVVESLVEANIVYGPLYASLSSVDVQRWSVYRAVGSFAHPLYASLFVAMGFGVAFGSFVERPRAVTFVAAILSIGGVLVTVSRSGIVAVAVAAAAVMLPVVVRSSQRSALFKVLVVSGIAAALAAVSTSSLLAQRLDSREADSSSMARSWGVDLAFTAAARSGWIGAGPGTSSDAIRELQSFEILLENGYLQLLVSAGVLGLVLFTVLLFGAGAVAFRRQSYAALGALVAFAVSIAGFNGLESNPSMLVLLGAALLLAVEPRGAHARPGPGTHALARPLVET